MGKFLQRLQDVFYISTVRLGGANFQDMDCGAEEWTPMEPTEATEIKRLFGKLAPREQGLCLGLLLRSRYPQLFQRAPEQLRKGDVAGSFCMSLKSRPGSSPCHRHQPIRPFQPPMLVTTSFDLGTAMQARASIHAELPAFLPASSPSLKPQPCPAAMAPEWQGDLLDSIMDIMQTCPDGLVLPASEPAPPMRLDRNIMLTLAGDDAPVEAIEKLMWKMEVMSSKSPSAWAAALSLLSSTRQEVGAGESSHLLGTFDALLPLSTQV